MGIATGLLQGAETALTSAGSYLEKNPQFTLQISKDLSNVGAGLFETHIMNQAYKRSIQAKKTDVSKYLKQRKQIRMPDIGILS